MNPLVKMRKTITIVLLLAILVHGNRRMIILAFYDVNKDYIAQNICENRNKPGQCCQGKCYLENALKKEQKNETQRFPEKERSEILWLPLLSIEEYSFLRYKKLIKNFSHYFSYYFFVFAVAFFHPPCQTCLI